HRGRRHGVRRHHHAGPVHVRPQRRPGRERALPGAAAPARAAAVLPREAPGLRDLPRPATVRPGEVRPLTGARAGAAAALLLAAVAGGHAAAPATAATPPNASPPLQATTPLQAVTPLHATPVDGGLRGEIRGARPVDDGRV